MNKLRLIKIYEFKGKVHPIETSIIELLDGINETFYSNYKYYSKVGIIYFSYNLNNNNILLSSYLEREFNTKFGCSPEETKAIMKYLLEKHLKLEIRELIS